MDSPVSWPIDWMNWLIGQGQRKHTNNWNVLIRLKFSRGKRFFYWFFKSKSGNVSVVRCSELRPNHCPISSAFQGHHVLSSEHLTHRAEHTAAWLASEEKSRALSVLWRKPNSSIRFQMCAIWLITSEKRIKVWFFYIILFPWLSVSE